MTARTLRAFARRFPAARSIVVSGWRAAACATCPAARAGRGLGRVTVRSATSSANWWASELADITGLLGGHGDGGEVEATAGGNACGDSALDERCVSEGNLFAATVGLKIGQQCESGQDRTAEVGNEQHP